MVSQRLPCESPTNADFLGQPLKLRSGRVIRNRIMKAALTEKVSSYSPNNLLEHGLPSETLLNMYEKWGNGGFGIILTGNIVIDPVHLESAGNVVICKENDSPKLRELLKKYAANCKQDGALAVAQLSHAGRQTPETVNPHPKSASDVQLEWKRRGVGFAKPTPFTEEEIQSEVIERFAYAAKVCSEVGFDGVQMHGAHGYLLAQFMSPTTNKRTDKYGGIPENRVRIVLEAYDAIRKTVPSTFAVAIKMNSVEFQDQGLETSDARIMCALMEERGFDFVEMSGGTYEKLAFLHLRDSTRAREAFFLDFSDQIRNVFKNTAMFVTGGFRTVKGMSDAIANGSCDGVGLGRPITAEPDLPKKILQDGILSAVHNKLDEQDFGITNIASNTQMWQAGQQTLSAVGNDITADIMDLSVQSTVEHFLEAVKEYSERVATLSQAGEANVGVLEYKVGGGNKL